MLGKRAAKKIVKSPFYVETFSLRITYLYMDANALPTDPGELRAMLLGMQEKLIIALEQRELAQQQIALLSSTVAEQQQKPPVPQGRHPQCRRREPPDHGSAAMEVPQGRQKTHWDATLSSLRDLGQNALPSPAARAAGIWDCRPYRD